MNDDPELIPVESVTAGLMAEPPRSPHWPAVRKAHLESHPTCEACGLDVGLNVHHVRPFHLDEALECVESNLVTLCEAHGCHLSFGHLFNWRSFNTNVREDAAAWLKKVRSRP